MTLLDVRAGPPGSGLEPGPGPGGTDLSLLHLLGKYKADLQNLRFIAKTNKFILNLTKHFFNFPQRGFNPKGHIFFKKGQKLFKKLVFTIRRDTLENAHFSRLIA